MQRSVNRILTTHVGSLVRPMSVRKAMAARDMELPYDVDQFNRELAREVGGVVRKQAEVGIDVVSDGEFGKSGWTRYVTERMSGFTHRPAYPGEKPFNLHEIIREADVFPEFYAAYSVLQNFDWLSPDETSFRTRKDAADARLIWECTGPIGYRGKSDLQKDIDNFRQAISHANIVEGFLPVAAPMSARGQWKNSYYKDEDDALTALAEALSQEYRAIVDAGFVLQIDDAYLAHEYDRLLGQMDAKDVHKYCESRIELLNHALAGLPEEKVRYHVCWGSWNAPHTTDIPLARIVDLVLKVKAQAYSLEAANPRHEHEWRIWEDVKLPDGKILIPGVVTHSTNVVEHPEVVASRIGNFAKTVGRENVIAGTDCGFAQSFTVARLHPSVQWAKLSALVEGARLASQQLWA